MRPDALCDASLVKSHVALIATTSAVPSHAFPADLVSSDDLVARVTAEIREALPDSDATLDAVARRLGLSPTDLYRRLRRCGAEFRHLVRAQRHELAVGHMRDHSISLTEIALQLGYSELSAFSRAFRQWTGVSPAQYRRRYG